MLVTSGDSVQLKKERFLRELSSMCSTKTLSSGDLYFQEGRGCVLVFWIQL